MQNARLDNSPEDMPLEDFQALCNRASTRLRPRIESGVVFFLMLGTYGWLGYFIKDYFFAKAPLQYSVLYAAVFLCGMWLLFNLVSRVILAIYSAAIRRELARHSA